MRRQQHTRSRIFTSIGREFAELGHIARSFHQSSHPLKSGFWKASHHPRLTPQKVVVPSLVRSFLLGQQTSMSESIMSTRIATFFFIALQPPRVTFPKKSLRGHTWAFVWNQSDCLYGSFLALGYHIPGFKPVVLRLSLLFDGLLLL